MKRQRTMRCAGGWPLGAAALLVLLAVLLGGVPAQAGPNLWTSAGPRHLWSIAGRDNNGDVYLIFGGPIGESHNGQPGTAVYKSADGGEHWSVVGDYARATGLDPFDTPDADTLAVSPDGRTLLLHVPRASNPLILRSRDGGASWEVASRGFRTSYMVFDPNDSQRVYADGHPGFYRSLDGGSTWSQMAGASDGADYEAGLIAVDPRNPAHLVAASLKSIKVSDDYGASWRLAAPAGNGVPGLSEAGDFLSFVQPDPAQPDAPHLMIAADINGAYFSKDAGLSWAKASDVVPGVPLGITSARGRIYLLVKRSGADQQVQHSLYTSTDGEHWVEQPQQSGAGRPNYEAFTYGIFLSEKDPQRIFRSDGAFSADGGNTWASRLADLPTSETPIGALYLGPQGLLAANGSALYRSAGGGTSWDLLYSRADIYLNINAVAQHDNVVLLHLFPQLMSGGGTQRYTGTPSLLRSTDGGLTWSEPVLYTYGQNARFTFARAAIYLAVSPETSGRPFPGEHKGSGGLYRSLDSGATWATLQPGMPVNNVVVDPADERHLWAAGGEGLAESRDGGASWSKLSASQGWIVANEPGSSRVLYASGVGQAGVGPLFRSGDGGHSWAQLAAGGAQNSYRTKTFAVIAPGQLVVGWATGDYAPAQVSLTTDGGQTWSALNTIGLGHDVLELQPDPAQNRLLAIGNDPYNRRLLSYSIVQAAPDPAFQQVWQRQDQLVAGGSANRSWTWGPAPFATIREPLEGFPGGSRIVQYYDKARMEVNDPGADRSSPYFVTNGRLTYEMVAGRVQVGLNKWEPRAPARIAVAFDQTGYGFPTYASFRPVATGAGGGSAAPNRTGQSVDQAISQFGVSSEVPATVTVRLAMYDQKAGHNIAAPFWEFLNRRGQVLENGVPVEKPLLGDWVAVMGRPITEPYWARRGVSYDDRWVLIQLFERRVLTYSPNNEPAWQVEMGNVGRHYYLWRYGEIWQ